jgi:GNAT superfamily N-acetyltransferase
MTSSGADLAVRPLTPERWDDFVHLFGPRGACGGCWCMHWRLSRGDYERRKGAGNRDAMRRLVTRGAPAPGVLGYMAGEAVGWCAVAPRDAYPRLGRSRVLRPVDDEPVWSVVCLFVAPPHRRRGVSVALLGGAAAFAEANGAAIVEGYPVDAGHGEMPAVFAWTGTAAAFRAAGFEEVARRSPSRPIMRRRFARALRQAEKPTPGKSRRGAVTPDQTRI